MNGRREERKKAASNWSGTFLRRKLRPISKSGGRLLGSNENEIDLSIRWMATFYYKKIIMFYFYFILFIFCALFELSLVPGHCVLHILRMIYFLNMRKREEERSGVE